MSHSSDGQIDRGNPLCLTLTCLQTHFSWRGMRAKQNRMLSRVSRFRGRGGWICVLALKTGHKRSLKVKKKHFLMQPVCRFTVTFQAPLYVFDLSAPLGTCSSAVLECERSPLTPWTNTRRKQAYQGGLLAQDKH